MENIDDRDSGKVVKLVIYAYQNKNYSGKRKKFVLPINPEKYDQTLKIAQDSTQAAGNQGNSSRLNKTPSQTLKLDFVFDGTGTVEYVAKEQEGKDVRTQVVDFLEVVYKFDRKTHQPRFLKLIWGDLYAECKLEEVKIDYTLFNPDGSPLRAKLSATFKGYVEPRKRLAEEDKESPDLTHERMVLEGDNLPFVSYDQYGSPEFYIQLAQQNNLTNIRSLKVGRRLILPSIERTER